MTLHNALGGRDLYVPVSMLSSAARRLASQIGAQPAQSLVKGHGGRRVYIPFAKAPQRYQEFCKLFAEKPQLSIDELTDRLDCTSRTVLRYRAKLRASPDPAFPVCDIERRRTPRRLALADLMHALRDVL